MAHMVESMFYNRETPWHGLGRRVEHALTAKEALVAAELDWNVIQHPVFVDGKTAHGYVANVRDIDNSVLGIVTNKYKIVQNEDAFSFTDALLDHDVLYETAGSLNKGKKVWMLAKLPQQIVLGDEINPYLCFTNSHDGTGAIKVMVTPVRVVCNNTLNLALGTAKRCWSTKHMGNMEGKLIEAKRTLELTTDYLEKFETNAVDMANKIIDEADFKIFLDELFPFPIEKDATNRKIENVKTMRNNLIITYNREDIREFRNTAWGVINAVSDMVTHSEPLRQTDTYKENLWGKVMEGHGVLDQAYEILQKIAA
jgi:phage/plasmid-like protein (TIGR03299 family)